MVTIQIGAHSQAQGTLVRRDGNMAQVNVGGQLLYGKLIAPQEKPETPGS